MDRERQEFLERIMAVEFTLIELNLFLDTHPRNEQALAEYQRVQEELNELKCEFSQRYYPLNPTLVPPGRDWAWIRGPWPWEETFLPRR